MSSKWTEPDAVFMRRALALAESQAGKTSPDPMVGAVLVKDGRILSEGYHGRVTTPHAEAWAIKKVGRAAHGASLYVNLEPCCYFETKTNPPCTHAIIGAGLAKVYISMVDPNPMVSGRGINEIKETGIEVSVGLLEREARKINEVFIKYITTGRPFVALKSAMSIDGKIATAGGESFWITGVKARRQAHHLRAIYDAVMVGIGTILKDDPELTVRHVEGQNPIKVVIDPRLDLPAKSKVIRNEPEQVIIVASNRASLSKQKALEKRGCQVLRFPAASGEIDLNCLMDELGKRKITSVLIEGGGRLNASALKFNIVDKINFFIAPKIIGGANSLSPVEGEGVGRLSDAYKIKDVSVKCFGEDILVEGYL